MGNDVTKQDVALEAMDEREIIQQLQKKYNISDEDMIALGVQFMSVYELYPF